MFGSIERAAGRAKGQAATRGHIKTPHVLLHGEEHKSCSKCGSLRPLKAFSKDGRALDGLLSSCRRCRAEAA